MAPVLLLAIAALAVAAASGSKGRKAPESAEDVIWQNATEIRTGVIDRYNDCSQAFSTLPGSLQKGVEQEIRNLSLDTIPLSDAKKTVQKLRGQGLNTAADCYEGIIKFIEEKR